MTTPGQAAYEAFHLAAEKVETALLWGDLTPALKAVWERSAIAAIASAKLPVMRRGALEWVIYLTNELPDTTDGRTVLSCAELVCRAAARVMEGGQLAAALPAQMERVKIEE